MWSGLATLGGMLGLGLLGGASSYISSSMGAASSDRAAQLAYDAQIATNAMNYQIARENRKFQQQMYDTAHQREVKDLREAGLNPILSATGGSGSGVATQDMPTMVSPGSPKADTGALLSAMGANLVNSFSGAASLAKDFSSTMKNLAVAENTAAKTDKEVGKSNPYTILANQLESAWKGKDPRGFLPAFTGLLKDTFGALKSQFNVYQKTLQYHQRSPQNVSTPRLLDDSIPISSFSNGSF